MQIWNESSAYYVTMWSVYIYFRFILEQNYLMIWELRNLMGERRFHGYRLTTYRKYIQARQVHISEEVRQAHECISRHFTFQHYKKKLVLSTHMGRCQKGRHEVS